MKNIQTTVIGSYPVTIDTMEFIKTYFLQKKTDQKWKRYIKTAVQKMLDAGIDIITDGQTRDPFIQLFARKLKGCRIRNRVEIIDKIEYTKPITIEDQKYVKTLLPKNKKLKGVITGPYTLTRAATDLHYMDEKQLAFDFAYALKQEAENLQKHVDIISIDEPFFSEQVPEYGKELISIITKNLRRPTTLHVCGDIRKNISQILEMPVDILSHEFKGIPELLNEFKQYSFQQKICLGSVRSDNITVENVEEIILHIKKAIDILGNKIIHISPDCGQRFLPPQIAYQKLKNLVEAGGIINEG